MDTILILIVAGTIIYCLVAAPVKLIGYLRQQGLKNRICNVAGELGLIVADNFLAQPCPRCHESELILLSVSSNARSIHCECSNCKKKAHAPASNPQADDAAHIYEQMTALIDKYNGRYQDPLEVNIRFSVPDAPLPYEQTRREPISEAVRSEVWRRDGGCCVKCGSNQNLEFDHIIPVSRGGATSVANLQLLCRACNRGKSNKI
jgi:5-methylcytosine-specific restriction endonuclease McrA